MNVWRVYTGSLDGAHHIVLALTAEQAEALVAAKLQFTFGPPRAELVTFDATGVEEQTYPRGYVP